MYSLTSVSVTVAGHGPVVGVVSSADLSVGWGALVSPWSGRILASSGVSPSGVGHSVLLSVCRLLGVVGTVTGTRSAVAASHDSVSSGSTALCGGEVSGVVPFVVSSVNVVDVPCSHNSGVSGVMVVVLGTGGVVVLTLVR